MTNEEVATLRLLVANLTVTLLIAAVTVTTLALVLVTR